jgi:hypothetical protein
MEPHVSPSRRGDLRALVVALAVLGLFVAGFAAFGATSNDANDKVDVSEGADDTGGGGGSGDGGDRASSQLAESTTSDTEEHDMAAMEHADGDHDMAGMEHADGADHGDGDHDMAGGAHDASHDSGDHNHATGSSTPGDHTGDHNHDTGSTTPGDTTHGEHNHDTGSTTPGDTTHGEHNHDPGTTVPGDTTHGEHNHDPGTTVPGDTTPATGGHEHEHPTDTTNPGDPTTPTTGHHHPPEVYAQIGDLPPAVQYQIGAMTKWAMNYDTTAKATAGGFPKLTQYFPGIAAHYINIGRLFDNQPFDWSQPEVLLFNGTGPDAQLVGFNYIVQGGPNHTPPDGFPGDFDQWHEHPVLCMKNGIVVGEVAQGQTCPAGQSTLPFQNMWLLHVWAIPGWESPEGIFSHENSRV